MPTHVQELGCCCFTWSCLVSLFPSTINVFQCLKTVCFYSIWSTQCYCRTGLTMGWSLWLGCWWCSSTLLKNLLSSFDVIVRWVGSSAKIWVRVALSLAVGPPLSMPNFSLPTCQCQSLQTKISLIASHLWQNGALSQLELLSHNNHVH